MVVTQGDIFFVDFNPSIGHEQRNKRPAIALSHDLVARFGGLTKFHINLLGYSYSVISAIIP